MTLVTTLSQAYVLPPKKMAFLSSPVEVEVGHVLQLPLVVYAVLGRMALILLQWCGFTFCGQYDCDYFTMVINYWLKNMIVLSCIIITCA